MPIPSASSKIFWPCSKCFDLIQYFLNLVKYFWAWSKVIFYLIILHNWAWSKIFEHIQKYWTRSKFFEHIQKRIWTSRWIRHYYFSSGGCITLGNNLTFTKAYLVTILKTLIDNIAAKVIIHKSHCWVSLHIVLNRKWMTKNRAGSNSSSQGC